MRRHAILVFTLLAYAAFGIGGGAFIICVHNDGHAQLEWANEPCCSVENRIDNATSFQNDDAYECCDCKDFACTLNSHLDTTEAKHLCKSGLNTDMVVDSPTELCNSESALIIDQLIFHGPLLDPFLIRLRTVAIRC